METPKYSDTEMLLGVHNLSKREQSESQNPQQVLQCSGLSKEPSGTPALPSATSSGIDPHHSTLPNEDVKSVTAMGITVKHDGATSCTLDLDFTRCCRHVEAETVLQAYNSVFDTNKVGSFLAVTGPSGTGKTSLIKNTLQQRVQSRNGFFIAGKFDQLCRPEPYAGFVAAFTDFTNQVVRRGPDSVKKIRGAILDVINSEQARVLVSMIPSLTCILGDRPDSGDEEPSSPHRADDAVQRFLFVFRLFLQCISSTDHPIVLLIDDWQFADQGSKELLASSVADLNNCEGLFVVATDTCETKTDKTECNMSEDWSLNKILHTAEKSNHATTRRITLSNLSVQQVVVLLSDSLQLSGVDRCEEFGEIVTLHTKGNALRIDQLVLYLYEKELLSKDTFTASWDWDLEDISAALAATSPSASPFCFKDFLHDKLTSLSSDTIEVLKVAACLGSCPDQSHIAIALKRPVQVDLFEATQQGFFYRDSCTETAPYYFKHDRIQAMAYNLIPETQRALYHLEIGRRLWRQMKSVELDSSIFVVVSQMNLGKHLITREKERYAVAGLCLHAGKKAALSSAFSTSLVYLDLAIDLLDESAWEKQYDLTLAVYNAACEMEMCTANFEKMEELVQVVLQNAHNVGDKLQAYSSQIYSLDVSDRQVDAIVIAMEVLEGLNETFPRCLRKLQLMKEMRCVKRLLKGKSNEQLLRLPSISDEEKLAAMQILNLMYIPSIAIDPVLSVFVSLKLLKLTVQYGTCLISPVAFSAYGMVCVSVARDVDEGFRFGELGLEMLERSGAKQYLPRVYAAFYGCIYPWKKPVNNTLDHLLHAYRVGMESGDTEFGCLNANIYCFYAFESGLALDQIESSWCEFQETMTSHRQKSQMAMSLPTMQLIHHFMGYSSDPLATKGDLIDSEEFFQNCIDKKQLYHAQEISCTQMILAYVLNEYDLAERHSRMGVKDFWQQPPSIESVFSAFIGALSALGVAGKGKNIRKSVRFAKGILKSIKRFARVNPHNFLDKMYLLEAEIARVAGKLDLALQNYAAAIAVAHRNGFILVEAIANERLARFHLESGGEMDAEPYLRRSCSLYRKWGGSVKYDRLQAEYSLLFGCVEAKPVVKGE